MGSKIEWTDETWNPFVGCTHISAGCDHCYAARQASGRLRNTPTYQGLTTFGRFNGTVRLLPERPDSLTLAYLAGVIDSDGYITINRSTRKGVVYFGAVIGVSGTRRQPHDLAASLWGGRVGYYQPKNPRHRGQFLWSRQGAAAAVAIAEVMPYLRVKIDQAWLAIELNDHVLSGQGEDPFPWFSPDYDPAPHREALVAEMRSLNQSRKVTADAS